MMMLMVKRLGANGSKDAVVYPLTPTNLAGWSKRVSRPGSCKLAFAAMMMMMVIMVMMMMMVMGGMMMMMMVIMVKMVVRQMH